MLTPTDGSFDEIDSVLTLNLAAGYGLQATGKIQKSFPKLEA